MEPEPEKQPDYTAMRAEHSQTNGGSRATAELQSSPGLEPSQRSSSQTSNEPSRYRFINSDGKRSTSASGLFDGPAGSSETMGSTAAGVSREEEDEAMSAGEST